jgi:hypothetical protein
MDATHLRVTNNNDFEISDRYDGVYYSFSPKKSVVIPVHAGVLLFGFALDENGYPILGDDERVTPNYAHMQRRWGWNTVERQKDEEMAVAVNRTNAAALKRCQAITVEAIVLALREVKAGGELLAPRSDDVKTAKAG